ncbi:unnamed protein product [Trichogramma brassicae]|uniref:methylated diphthine methylhydrolase n=1 Tax=Trichogramma brassicae TaxID=86971 RepID=A0A6H5I2I1_9HYME|nr:unnamed protein product [Trichogramma brassicae]
MFKTLQTFDTELSADSVEWCPHENFADIMVCGTYELKVEDEGGSKRERIGRIYLMKLNEQRSGLDVLQTIEVSAVLDMKWSRTTQFASHAGCRERRRLFEDLRIEADDEEEERLALSLDWAADQTRLTLSDSKGCVSCWQFQADTGNFERLVEWPAHDFEAWITCFDLRNSEVVYTGGDDLKMRSFDLRSGPIATNSRSHGAGVTSLQFHPAKEYSFVSGSYDEQLRHWDTRQLKRPVHELPLGGGLWRLKYEPSPQQPPRYLLAAGMYGGFFLVDVVDQEQPRVVENFQEHKSIAYGCDWSYSKRADDDPPLVATCSFYDHCLKLCSINTEDQC